MTPSAAACCTAVRRSRSTHKSRELLVLFLNNPGRLLTRNQIIEKVWPDVAVTDDALRFQLTELRKAFGDEGADFIKTIRREGYRWEAPVRAAADRPVRGAPDDTGQRPVPRFRLVLETREVQLLDGEERCRPRRGCRALDRPSIRCRATTPRSVVAHDKVTLEDLESKNGTYLNGKKIGRRTTLEDGDHVRVGPETMAFRTLSAETTQTERKS